MLGKFPANTSPPRKGKRIESLPLVSFPKATAFFGIVDIHGLHPGNPFYLKGLSKTQVLHARQNYSTVI